MNKEPENQDLLPAFIELETSTRCNRSCSWCPNSRYERGKEQKYIKHGLFDKIIDDLAALSYRGELALHNYNEPLLDEHLFEHISAIRQRLGKALLTIFTNGDYLDQIMLRQLEQSGVQTLIISLHDLVGRENIHEIIQQLEQKLGVDERGIYESDHVGVKLVTHYKGMKLVYYIPYQHMLTSRGGIIKKYNTKPGGDRSCYLPFSSCAIDYQGNMKICCEVYLPNAVHRKHGIIGNLSEHSFAELWFSDEFNAFRQRILACLNTNTLCSHCPGYRFGIDEKRMNAWKRLL